MFSATVPKIPMTRKEFCVWRRIHASTLRRWERRGLKVLQGRIAEDDFARWAERNESQDLAEA